MTTGFTKGPWRTRRLKRSIEIFWPETGQRVAGVPLSEFVENSGNEANARLIAAAPDLLDALKAVLSVADRKTDEFDRAHAAIAKAEGKQ
jgi:hypothetical protein